MTPVKNIVFIDYRVSGYKALIPEFDQDTAWFVLYESEDGIAQIEKALEGFSGLNAIHIISHGAPGTLLIGQTSLDSDNLADYQEKLESIGTRLTETGDILLYGCNVASTALGKQFLQDFSKYTGADVAASTGISGPVQFGGGAPWEQIGLIGTATINLNALPASLTITMEIDYIDNASQNAPPSSGDTAYGTPDANANGSLNPFTLTPDANGSLNQVDPLCFVVNTRIATHRGLAFVQDLSIGDLILNDDGQSIPVKWIGKQRFNPRFGKENLPICISSGALGNGLPVRDLYVSPDHAMYIDNCVLVHAKALVNGTSIYQVTEWEGDVEYFHIETENHEIILAEGAPAETFIDNVSRKAFYNHAEYEALYPNAKPMIELDTPRVKYARQLPMATKQRLDTIVNKKCTSMANTA